MRVIEETPGYWRVVFDYPPFNVVDAEVFQALQDLPGPMETTESLRVVVFECASRLLPVAPRSDGQDRKHHDRGRPPSGLPILMDTFVRLTKAPVVSLARIRGCVRGVSSEFVLAYDMRFARRENTKLAPPFELGVGLHPGGGGTERLPHLVGRGRALEIVALSANDFDGDTAERYGYVNRSFPAAELDGFVDGLARRIGSFDRRALAAAKILVNYVVAPQPTDSWMLSLRLGPRWTWPEAQHRIQAVLQSADCNETPTSRKPWPEVLGNLVESEKERVKTMISKIEVERFSLDIVPAIR